MAKDQRIIVGDTPIQFRPITSKRFVCSKCLDFLIEHTPVLNQDLIKGYIRENGIPKVKMECGRGCHNSPWFSFYDINDPKTRSRY